jgi:predicted HTH domain antitoxin
MENEREARRMVEPIDQVDVVYKIRGKRVIFTRACEMTARQLAMILAEVE